MPNTAVQVVISYTTSDLQKHAYAGEIFANLLAERLGLKELLAKRIGKPLQPHRKAGRKKATQGAKQKRPPRSSRA